MITSMFKLIAVTNRHLCNEPLVQRLDRLTRAGVDLIILREKDLERKQYEELAQQGCGICKGRLILHGFADAAQHLGYHRLHLPLHVLQSLSIQERERFSVLGASCHSLSDVLTAQQLGCSYVTLGHIFATDCKKGLPPRGVEFLEQVCRESQLPVYAIGGINAETIRLTVDAGASGACLMSTLMTCPDPEVIIKNLKQTIG